MKKTLDSNHKDWVFDKNGYISTWEKKDYDSYYSKGRKQRRLEEKEIKK